jgi:hypothetical protein
MSGFSVNSTDLSTIFKARTSAPGPITNFKDSNGNDLNQLFEVSSTPGTFGPDQISYDTSYITIYNSVPCDLRYIFQNIIVYFSPSENFVLVQSGSSYTLSCIQSDTSNNNTIIFKVPISNVVVTLVGGGGGGGTSTILNGGGGGGGGNIGQYTLSSVEQNNSFSNLIIGEGGQPSGGTGGTTSCIFQNSSGTSSYSISGGSGGAGALSGGSGGASGWSGGSGGNGGIDISSIESTNGSDGPSYTISGTPYYFGGCGGGGSLNKGSSADGGLGGGGSGGFGTTGNKNQPYTTPYGTTYPAGSNVFPNTGGGGAGGNGNGSEIRLGQSGNSGIIVISFTYP